MAIRLYFASKEKHFVNNGRFSAAQMGYGFGEDGTPRMPPPSDAALCVLDDSVIPRAAPDFGAFAAQLPPFLDGCFADFERTPLPFHAALLDALDKDAPLYVPPRFLSLCPHAVAVVSAPQPRNSWASFLAENRRAYPNGWALEVTPWRVNLPFPADGEVSRYLPAALCHCRTQARRAMYWDTAESLTEKLTLAERHGCRAAIGLYDELHPLGLV